ncbi:biotin/lipoyl-containing protein [[Mycoplasma] testudinis]|uniref:biotin/lipoyl-containing protein n=1 Tax=[Mycoplasma] testudinis TaxID=33924 RepID=UPI00056BB5C3|nr:biotin/lipoyl-containing protein [[Mycoplasma] testudinis]
MYEFKFADIGEGLEEGKVNDILVKEGDVVKADDPVLNVETDKVTTDIPTPVGGVITKIFVTPGEVIHVGHVIALIDETASVSAPVAEVAPAPAPAPVEEVKVEEVHEEVKQEEAQPSGGASVVGEVKVSNKVLPLFGSQKKK